MDELDDITLLRQYAEQNSEKAFATLVSRHINKVYSVALRHTRNPHQAEEITQAVFVILARKSGDLAKGIVLSGWLYQTARLSAVTFLRSEFRRIRREQEAFMETVVNQSESDAWPQIAPLLDAGMARLSEVDRHAVVLRFFDGLSMKEVAGALDTSEDAAKMRVNRAVEKLRKFFTRQGVVLPVAALMVTISANAVHAAPIELATSVTVVAVEGTAMTTSTVALVKSTLRTMARIKLKTAIIMVGTASVVVFGTIGSIHVLRSYPALPKQLHHLLMR